MVTGVIVLSAIYPDPSVEHMFSWTLPIYHQLYPESKASLPQFIKIA